MKYLLALFLIIPLVGCKTAPGSDPLIVHAQQTRAVFVTTAKAYLSYEKDNRLTLWKVSHEFKKTADGIRTEFEGILVKTDDILDDYKALKTPDNSDRLSRQIKFLTDDIVVITAAYKDLQLQSKK